MNARFSGVPGKWFVPLADLWQGERLADALRTSLGLTATGGEPLEQLTGFLSQQEQLEIESSSRYIEEDDFMIANSNFLVVISDLSCAVINACFVVLLVFSK